MLSSFKDFFKSPAQAIDLVATAEYNLHVDNTIKQLECLKCGKQWYPRQPEPPRVCPQCKSPTWDRPAKFRRKPKGTASPSEDE